jgi:YHS domain-containing protein
MNKRIPIAILFLSICSSCNHEHKKQSSVPSGVRDTSHTDFTSHTMAAKENDFRTLSFANKKDLSCGMPLTAGIGDTVHYKGKLYGFCSKECKDAFLKDPESHLASLK